MYFPFLKKSVPLSSQVLHVVFVFVFYCFLERDERRERGKKQTKHLCERGTSICCLSYALLQGIQTHNPGMFESMMFRCMGCSNPLSHVGQGQVLHGLKIIVAHCTQVENCWYRLILKRSFRISKVLSMQLLNKWIMFFASDMHILDFSPLLCSLYKACYLTWQVSHGAIWDYVYLNSILLRSKIYSL